MMKMRLLISSKRGALLKILLVSLIVLVCTPLYQAAMQGADYTLLTVYDRGEVKSFLTTAKTIDEALKEQSITIGSRDNVEPSLDEALLAATYDVNIYRARPVIVSDGATRIKTTSAQQTPEHIARDAGMKLNPEDILQLSRSDEFIYDGAGLRVDIDRAVPLTLDIYGRVVQAHTQATTLGQLLKEKQIQLGPQDRVSPTEATSITSGMSVRVWREGKQTVSIDQAIPFGREIVYDMDRPLKYRAVKEAGTEGVQTITYEIEVVDGSEVSRRAISSVTTKQPQPQTEVIGLRNDGSGLSRTKGAHHVTDSKGIVHRETYYDLDMGVVMRSCGQNGQYAVRPDGAKIDSDGYILVAANYARYPKCSIVETSLGLGKVYDTGGFATVHPDGFDLATDWTNNNGR